MTARPASAKEGHATKQVLQSPGLQNAAMDGVRPGGPCAEAGGKKIEQNSLGEQSCVNKEDIDNCTTEQSERGRTEPNKKPDQGNTEDKVDNAEQQISAGDSVIRDTWVSEKVQPSTPNEQSTMAEASEGIIALL